MKTIILNLKAIFLPEVVIQDDRNMLFLENSQNKSLDYCPYFDPIAVKNVQEILDKTQAKVVLSDNWFWTKEFDITKYWCKKNGLNIKFHKNYVTPKKMSSLRINEIQWWLEENTKDQVILIIDENYSMKNLLSKHIDELKAINEYKEKYSKYIGVKKRKSLIPEFEYFQYEDKIPFYGLEAKRTLQIDEKVGLTNENLREALEIIESSMEEYNE